MVDQPDDAPDGRVLDDAEYLKVLNTRSDIFSIEGNSSLRAIGLLALFIGVCIGILLRAPHFYSQNERTVRFSGQTVEDMDAEEKPPLREISPSFFLKAKNALSPRNPPRRAPAHSVQKSAANRNPATLLSRSRAGGAKADAMLASQIMKAATTRDSTQATRKTIQVLESDSSLLHRGDQLKKGSDYTGAFAAYRRVLAQSPQNGKALAGMGDLFRYSGLLDSAVQFYRAALAVNPRNPAIHNGLGTALYENSKRALNRKYAKARNIQDPARYIKEQYDSAIAEYTEAISLDSSGVNALTNRGVLRDLNNDHEAAIKDYTLAIRLKPANADAYSKRADTYKDLGRLDAAVADYSAAIKLDSATYEFDPTLHFANAYFGRGAAYYKMGKLDEAIADFDSTLALSPKHSLALISKGVALADKKQYDSAITAYAKAISLLGPTEYNGVRMLAFLQRGNSWKALGKYDTAIADYQNAMESPNLASKACWRIAECFCFKKDVANALVWLKKAKSFRLADIKKWGHDRELSMLWNMPEFKELIRE